MADAQLCGLTTAQGTPFIPTIPSNCGRRRNEVLAKELRVTTEKNTALMPDPTEHHRDKRVVASAIPTLFANTYIAACNQSEAGFLQIAVKQEMGYNGFFSLVNTRVSARNLRRTKDSRRLTWAGISFFYSKGTP